MKRFLVAAACMAASPAHADAFDDRQRSFYALSAVDAAQTCYVIESGRGRELNPIYGHHPSCVKVMAIKAGFGILHGIVAREINERDPNAARIFQIVSLVLQGGVVAANFRVVF